MSWLEVEHYLNRMGRSYFPSTHFLGLSVGGTLCNAGVGRASIKRGHQIAHIADADVLLPNGNIVNCSSQKNTDIFRYAFANMGRLGIITRVSFQNSAHQITNTRFYYVLTENMDHYLKTLKELVHEEAENWDYFSSTYSEGKMLLIVGKNYVYERDLDNTAFAELNKRFKVVYKEDTDNYNLWIHKGLTEQIVGYENCCRLWGNFLLTYDALEQIMQHYATDFERLKVGSYYPEMYVFPVKRMSTDLFPFSPAYSKTNAGEMLYNFYPPYCLPHNDDIKKAGVQKMREILNACIQLGGRPYLYGSYKLSDEQWTQVYGEHYDKLMKLKLKYDPENILRNGQN